jgi:hypothetical protein
LRLFASESTTTTNTPRTHCNTLLVPRLLLGEAEMGRGHRQNGGQQQERHLDATWARHLNWTSSGQLIFGQFPRKIVPGMHTPRRKRKTAKGKSVSCAIAHTGLDYSIANMGSAIFFSPNAHQQQHFATSFNAFRHTSSDAQNITLFFSLSPKLCRGTYANQLHSDVS